MPLPGGEGEGAARVLLPALLGRQLPPISTLTHATMTPHSPAALLSWFSGAGARLAALGQKT